MGVAELINRMLKAAFPNEGVASDFGSGDEFLTLTFSGGMQAFVEMTTVEVRGITGIRTVQSYTGFLLGYIPATREDPEDWERLYVSDPERSLSACMMHLIQAIVKERVESAIAF